ncbi:MAG: hypothetical protein KF842_14840 [Caulobacter sp.]|nr:hypothetical protein [Caulobacter sp.]
MPHPQSEAAMPLPGLFGLVLICFLCGAAAALATGRRRSGFTGMAAALAGGLLAPWLAERLGWPLPGFWPLLAVIALSALAMTGLEALLHRR